MTVRDNVRRCCLLLVAGMALALVPATLFAQGQPASSANPGSPPGGWDWRSGVIAALTALGVAAIGGWVSVRVALIAAKNTASTTAKETSQYEIAHIDWNKLLGDDTIKAIKNQGHFVAEKEISGKLLQEAASNDFREVFKLGIRIAGEDDLAKLGKQVMDFVRGKGA